MSTTLPSNAVALWGAGQWGAGFFGSSPILFLPPFYYLNLFTSQYRQAPNLAAFTALLMQPIADANICLATFVPSFDIDYAVGQQLDALGAIQNISRTLPFQPSNNVSAVLDDATYRLLIQATIASNQWDGRLDSLQGIWQSLFDGGTIAVIDNMNMSATIILSGMFSSLIIDLIEHGFIVPRPQAVLYNYVTDGAPFLGFDYNNAFVAGFDMGHWT